MGQLQFFSERGHMTRATLWILQAHICNKVSEVGVLPPAVFAGVYALLAALVHDVVFQRLSAGAVVNHKVTRICVRHSATNAVVTHVGALLSELFCFIKLQHFLIIVSNFNISGRRKSFL